MPHFTPHIRLFTFSVLTLFFTVSKGFYAVAQKASTEAFRLKTVVIDPGHGGHDPGNLGTGRYKSKEKDVVLDVCMKLGELIKREYPSIKVIYTRTTDEFVTLDGRAQIANKANADLFISVHCNAAKSPSAAGSESFVLGLHRTEENLEVAMKENSSILLEEDHEKTYGGFDPNSPESIIALTMMQSAFLDQSVRISAFVQRQFTERVGRKDRGVKQAGFLVLRKASMPSILIELGFLTNAAEEDFLNSADGKDKMALAIFKGFKEYKITVEDPSNTPAANGKAPEPAPKEAVKEQEKPKQPEPEVKKPEAKADKKNEAKSMTAEEAEAEFNKKRKAELEAKLIEAEKEKAKALEEKKKKELEEKERKIKEERLAAEKLAAEKKAEEERIAKEKEELERKRTDETNAAKKAEEERIKAERLAEEERAALEKLEAARLAEELKRDYERKQADERAMAERLAEEEHQMAERRRAEEQARMAALREQAERIADEERMAAEQKIEEEREAARKAKLAQIEEDRKAREARILAEQQAAQPTNPAPDLKPAQRPNETSENSTAEALLTPEQAEAAYLAKRRAELEGRLSAVQAEAEAAQKKELPANPIQNQAEAAPAQKTEVEKPVATAVPQGAQSIVFKVQVLSTDKRLPQNAPQFKGQKVEEYVDGNMFKYTLGSTTNLDEVGNLQKEVRAKGFEGAFAVAFINGKRVTMQEARDILNKK